jgi:AraC-like DNA-binding protein
MEDRGRTWVRSVSARRGLLHRKSISITEIAFRLGFSDASAFRAATGIPPTKYRPMNG